VKIQPSKKLYDILEEAFDSCGQTSKHVWHDELKKLGVHAEVTNSGDGAPDLIQNIMNLVEEGCYGLQPDTQYVVCPDPMNHYSSKFFHILFFPKELADKVMILGFLPTESRYNYRRRGIRDSPEIKSRGKSRC
jgi:hypothetical protein